MAVIVNKLAIVNVGCVAYSRLTTAAAAQKIAKYRVPKSRIAGLYKQIEKG